jgi:hypothetical protein
MAWRTFILPSILITSYLFTYVVSCSLTLCRSKEGEFAA